MAQKYEQIVNYGLQNGKSKKEIIDALIKENELSNAGEYLGTLEGMGRFGSEEQKTIEDVPMTAADMGNRRGSIESAQILKNRIKEYKTFIDEKGFSGSFLSPDDLGKAETLRGLIITDIKQAQQLGALDTGLLDFASEIVGQKPERTMTDLNLFGKASKRISAQLGEFENQVNKDIESKQKALGITPASEGEESRDAIMQRFNNLHKFAQENPEDERAKKFLDDWNNDKFDLTTGKLKQEFKELTPFEQKEKEQKEKLAQETAMTPEEIAAMTDQESYGQKTITGETGLVKNLMDNIGDFKNNIVNTGVDLANNFTEAKDASVKTLEAIKAGNFDEVNNQMSIAGTSTAIGALGAMLGAAGSVGKLVGGLGGTAVELADDITGNVATKAVGAVIDSMMETEVGKQGFEALQAGKEQWSEYASKNPDNAAAISNVVGMLEGVSTVYGGGLAKKGVQKSVAGAVDVAGSAASKVGNVVDTGFDVVKNNGLVQQYTPENIMQRVARISKGKQVKFQEMAKGESIGDYLVNRKIFGDVDQISEKLFTRFKQSKDSVDKALDQLDGEYKTSAVGNALKELLAKETAVSVPGAMSKDIERVRSLVKKHKGQGLNMSEINEVKRLYERNVRLDFVKENLPEKVQRATNIDNAIRSFQFNKAKELGFKNLPELNKETMLSKQLLDDIGAEYAGMSGNNSITLTDWIILADGGVSAASAFAGKKLLSSKKLQSKIAEFFSRNKEKLKDPKAEIGEKAKGFKEFMQNQ